MIAQRAGGPDFTLSPGFGYGFSGGGVVVNQPGQYYGPGGTVDARTLLDADGDGTLSAAEIAAAPERLKSRDADDNDVLEATELGTAATGRRVGAGAGTRPTAGQTNVPLSVLLGPTARAADLFSVLKTAYAKDGELTSKSFPALKRLFDELDANHDDQLKENEVLALNRVAPHVRLKISFGDKAQGAVIDSIAAELEKPTSSGAAGTAVVLPGVKVAFAANPGRPRTYDYSQYGKQLLANYDKNSNGYIDKDEMPAGQAAQFAMWDENADDKVYAEEIVASYERQTAPRMSQVAASVSMQGNSLYAGLDANGDGRLGLREMRLASERIRSFDKNNDGQVSGPEIPVSMTVGFGLGGGYYGGYTAFGGGGRQPGTPAAQRGPDWFTRMDRNGDGDLTEREFLGTPEQFKKLDANSDGFIDLKEAEAAAPSGR
jgi:hypothetical protein